jgi:hypothetical protein
MKGFCKKYLFNVQYNVSYILIESTRKFFTLMVERPLEQSYGV